MSTPYKEAVLEFVKNRVEEGMEIFPTLETAMDILEAAIAFMIGFFSWLWDHPMWGTLGEHLKSGKEMLEDGFDIARDKFAQYQSEVVEENEEEEEEKEEEDD